MTGCFIKLLSQLPNILKTNGDHKDEKLEAIQTILDGIKMSGHATQNLVSIRPKEGIIVCRHSNLRQTTNMVLSENSRKFQKMTGQPKDPWLATRAPHSTTPQVHG